MRIKKATHFEQVPLEVVLQVANLHEDELPHADWHVPLREAQAETDPRRIHEKVMEAESVIFKRSQELANASDGHAERVAIKQGLDELLRIKTETLNWPDIRKRQD